MSVDDAVEEKSKRRRNNDDADEIIDDDAEERGLTGPKGRATPGKRTRRIITQQKSGSNFVTRAFQGVRSYFGGVKDELDKVVWPTREELIRLFRIVLTVTVLSALVLGAISFVYREIFILGLNKDQPIVFVLLFGGVGAAYFYFSRKSKSNVTL